MEKREKKPVHYSVPFLFQDTIVKANIKMYIYILPFTVVKVRLLSMLILKAREKIVKYRLTSAFAVVGKMISTRCILWIFLY